jgi:2-desacetyl-2-hydroxyethyl bacteriochlorophyllide A dehydrogenase
MKTKAILFAGVNDVVLSDVEVPAPKAGEVLIEAHYTCISPGTEKRCLAGQQAGAPAWPFIPGYAMSGMVIDAGPRTTLQPGTRVFCGGTSRASAKRLWGGHIGHAVQSEKNVFVVPDKVDLREASLVKLAAIAYHGARQTQPMAHDRVAAIGLGPIGMLAARMHALSGARVVCGDVSATRVAMARKSGLEAILIDGDLLGAFVNLFPDGVDIVIDSTGVPAVLAKAVELGKQAAWNDELHQPPRLLIQGSYAGDFTLPYHETFMREMQILLTRDQQPRDVVAVLDLLHRCKLSINDLISDVRKPKDAAKTYAELQSSRDAMTFAFKWN